MARTLEHVRWTGRRPVFSHGFIMRSCDPVCNNSASQPFVQLEVDRRIPFPVPIWWCIPSLVHGATRGRARRLDGNGLLYRIYAYHACLYPDYRQTIFELSKPMTIRYLEDFEPGQKFGSGRLRVDRERIKSFGAEFDPQPFHVDEGAARDSLFKGLAASGWHTAAMTMRLLVEGEFKPAGGIVGAGFDELRWPRPVRPGDELRVESEILEVRPSKSRPDQGLIKVKTTTLNQNGDAVQVSVGNLIVPRRPASSGEGPG